jgi:hypothetical protein
VSSGIGILKYLEVDLGSAQCEEGSNESREHEHDSDHSAVSTENFEIAEEYTVDEE